MEDSVMEVMVEDDSIQGCKDLGTNQDEIGQNSSLHHISKAKLQPHIQA